MGDVDASVLTLVGQALSFFAARLCLVWLADEGSTQLSGTAFAHGSAGTVSPTAHPALQLLSGVAGWVFRNARPLILNDWLQGPFPAQHLGREGAYRMGPTMCVPAARPDQVIGAVAVIGPESMEFTEADIAELTGIAQAIARRLESHRNDLNAKSTH